MARVMTFCCAILLSLSWPVAGRATPTAPEFDDFCLRYRMPIHVTLQSLPQTPGLGVLAEVIFRPSDWLNQVGENGLFDRLALRLVRHGAPWPVEVPFLLLFDPDSPDNDLFALRFVVAPDDLEVGQSADYYLYFDVDERCPENAEPPPLPPFENLHPNGGGETLQNGLPYFWNKYPNCTGCTVQLSTDQTIRLAGERSVRVTVTSATYNPTLYDYLLGSDMASLNQCVSHGGPPNCNALDVEPGHRYRLSAWLRDEQGAPFLPYLRIWADPGATAANLFPVPYQTGVSHFHPYSFEFQNPDPALGGYSLALPIFLVRAVGTSDSFNADELVVAPVRLQSQVQAAEQGAADLAIAAFGYTPSTSTLVFHVTVANRGGHPLENFAVSLTVNGQTQQQTVAEVAAFDQAIVDFPVAAGAGIFEVAALADSGHVVAERDETNNGYTTRFAIQQHPHLYFTVADLPDLQQRMIPAAPGEPDNSPAVRAWSYIRSEAERWVDVPYGGLAPQHWGWYLQAGAAALYSSPDAHFGQYSAAMKLAGRRWTDQQVRSALTFGGQDARQGSDAPALLADHSYDFSCWFKSPELSSLKPYALTWTAENQRQLVAASPATLTLAPTWTQLSGSFHTGAQTQRGVLYFEVSGVGSAPPVPSTLLVDDCSVVDAATGQDAGFVNGGAEAGQPLTTWIPDEDNIDPYTAYLDYETLGAIAWDAATMAFVYLIEEDPRFGQRARDYLLNICAVPYWINKCFRIADRWTDLRSGLIARRMAEAYDWAYAALSEEDRDTLQACFVSHALEGASSDIRHGAYDAPSNWIPVALGGAGILALAILGELSDNPGLDPYLPEIRQRMQAYLDTAIDEDGLALEGLSYQLYGLGAGAIQWSDALRTAGLEDLWQLPSLRNAWTMQVYQLMDLTVEYSNATLRYWTAPDVYTDRTGQIVKRDKYVHTFGDGYTLYNRMPASINARFAAATNNGYAQWLQNENWDKDVEYLYHYLWFDPTVAAVDPSGLPTDRVFDGAGWVTSRSGTGPHDTWLAFHAGPYLGGHAHADQNELLLFSGGEPLLVEAGTRNYIDTSENDEYQFVAGHNTLMVDQDPHSQIIAAGQGGNLQSAVTTDALSHWTGDASAVYPALSQFQRHVIHRKGGFVAFADRVTAAGGSVLLREQFHAFDKGFQSNVFAIEDNAVRLQGSDRDLVALPMYPMVAEDVDGPQLLFTNSDTALLSPADFNTYRLAFGPAQNVMQALLGHILFVTAKGSEAPPTVLVDDEDNETAVGASMDLGFETDTVFFRKSDQQEAAIDEIVSDALFGMVARDEKTDQVILAAVNQGSFLMDRGAALVRTDRPAAVTVQWGPSDVQATLVAEGSIELGVNVGLQYVPESATFLPQDNDDLVPAGPGIPLDFVFVPHTARVQVVMPKSGHLIVNRNFCGCFHDGDVNEDDALSAGDAQLAFFIALEMITPTAEQLCAADVNGDGSVSAGDAQSIFWAALGMAELPSGLPDGQCCMTAQQCASGQCVHNACGAVSEARR